MNSYELSYLFPSDFSEEENNKIKAEITSVLEKNEAKIENTDKPVVRDLGYTIKNKRVSLLVTVLFNSSPEKIKIIEKGLKEKKELLRFMITKKDKRKESSLKRRNKKPLKEETGENNIKEKEIKKEIKKEKPKVEFKEIEKKLDEILGE
jgi:ribosomal protein S6